MFPFRRRKNAAETHLAFQKAAEDWLRLPRDAHADAIILQAGQVGGKGASTDDTHCGREGVPSSLVESPPPAVEIKSLSRVAPHLVPLLTPDAFEAEPYRILGHLVGQMHDTADLRILAISSPSSGDGKTSTALNLAGILAQAPETRVLLVEAELRRPSIAQYLGIRHTTAGLGGAILESTLPLERFVQRCRSFNLDLLLAGRSSATPYDLLKLPRFGALLQEGRQHYDYVLVDTPPLLPFADYRLIEKWIDGLLVVVAAHKTLRKMLQEALDIVDPTKLIGLVLNQDDYQATRYNQAYRYYAQPSSRHRQGDLLSHDPE